MICALLLLTHQRNKRNFLCLVLTIQFLKANNLYRAFFYLLSVFLAISLII